MLSKHRRKVKFSYADISSLEGYVKAMVIMVYSIYEERICTLNDYMTVKKGMSARAIELEMHSSRSAGNPVNGMVKKGKLTLPYSILIPLWFKAQPRKSLPIK